MSNTFFKFKQFTIHQDKCAMKVCTDACLFGAIISNELKEYNHVLDIGTGTGLLSLMFAQKHVESKIDAVEIDTDACIQAQQNINAVEFGTNIKLFNEDIRTYETSIKYNLIFSNPPFYTNDLKSEDDKKNIAMHSSQLSYDELLDKVYYLLNKDGKFFILVPFHLENKVIEIATKHFLFCIELIRVRQSTTHNYFRSIICFSKEKQETNFSELIIKDNSNNYTEEFKLLLKDYYLHL